MFLVLGGGGGGSQSAVYIKCIVLTGILTLKLFEMRQRAHHVHVHRGLRAGYSAQWTRKRGRERKKDGGEGGAECQGE